MKVLVSDNLGEAGVRPGGHRERTVLPHVTAEALIERLRLMEAVDLAVG